MNARRFLLAALSTLLAFAFGGTAIVFASDAFAPKLEVPADARAIDRGMVEGAVVPSRAEVGVPAYPGSKVARSTRPAQEGGDGEAVRLLPSVTLLTDADPETVAAWYAENLDGWKRSSQMGMVFFHPEGVELDMVHIGSHRLVSIVPIVPNMPFARLWPAAKTEITIAYEGR